MAKRKSLIKIKSKPILPTRRRKCVYTHSIYYGESLLNLVNWAKNVNAPLDEVYIDLDVSSGEDEILLHYEGSEPEDEFKKRMLNYNKRFDEYNKWYNSNKKLIDQELELRKKEKKERAQKEKDTEKKILEKKLNQIHKELEKLK